MKVYMVKSYDNSERYSIHHVHGIYGELKLAQEAIPKVWYSIFRDSWGEKTEPTTKNDNEWVQKWGQSIEDGGDGHFMNGYGISIEEVELNKTYESLEPSTWIVGEERLKEIL